jgi:o-succinylbenzoate---CoA ligase
VSAVDVATTSIRYREGLRTEDEERRVGELIAVRCGPEQVGRTLRMLWDAGDAALLLPWDGPAAAVTRILASQRPAALLDLRTGDADHRARVPLPAPLPHLPAPRHPLPAPLPVADDVALVVTTSGSTGRPKGVELTHAALRASAASSIDRLGCRPGERWALALPTHHVAGVQVLLRSWALGTDAAVVADLADLVELSSDEVQHVSLVPTQLGRLLDAHAPLSRFGSILLGGARADPALLDRARAAGANVVVSYGMSETGGGCVYDGRPLDGVEVALQGGRIRLRGPVLFVGYRGEPPGAALDDAGWFTTGDLGRFDDDGRLEVLGRADDVIISGGENVPVPAVEATLLRAPGVAEVGVTGRADPEWGQVVIAVIVPTDRQQPPSCEALRAHVRQEHPAAWAPREVVVVDRLPRDPMGKVSRAALDQLPRGT